MPSLYPNKDKIKVWGEHNQIAMLDDNDVDFIKQYNHVLHSLTCFSILIHVQKDWLYVHAYSNIYQSSAPDTSRIVHWSLSYKCKALKQSWHQFHMRMSGQSKPIKWQTQTLEMKIIRHTMLTD